MTTTMRRISARKIVIFIIVVFPYLVIIRLLNSSAINSTSTAPSLNNRQTKDVQTLPFNSSSTPNLMEELNVKLPNVKLSNSNFDTEKRKSKNDSKYSESRIKDNTHKGNTFVQTFTNPSVIRPYNCSGCFHTNFSTLIDQSEVCAVQGNRTIDIIFLIVSAPKNVAQRRAIRKTWVSCTKNNTSNFRHVFMLGMTSDSTVARAVQEESRHFRDVVVMGFQDSYKNLTVKVLASLHWLTARCPHAKHFMKVDDDVWINTQVTTALVLNHTLFLQRGIGGFCSNTYRVDRKKKSKWYIPETMFPKDRYPPYCQGYAYASSMIVAQQLLRVSPDIPFFKFEDVYIGICLQRLGFKTKTFPNFKKLFQKDLCQDLAPGVATVLNVKPDKLLALWNATCPVVKSKQS